MPRLTALLCFVLALVCRGETFTAQVDHVIDGDTIAVLRNGAVVRVRLWGVDAPERKQPRADEAREVLQRKLDGKAVDVDVVSRDRYKRLVARVSVNGQCVNLELLNAGWAWWYARYAPAAGEYAAAQDAAKTARRGIWMDFDAMAPWEWTRR